MALLLFVGASEGASDSREVVQASEIQAAIERGDPVEYDDMIVEGDLDLGGMALDTVHFNNTIFRGSVNFRGTDFTGDAWFQGAQFSGDADFRWARFSGSGDFGEAQFSGDNINFAHAQFSGYADFTRAQFSGGAFGGAYFWWARFSGYADFRWARFSGSGDFGEAQFSGGANFGGAQFSKRARFENAQVRCRASFGQAQINGDADFGGAQFYNWTSFTETQFSGYADFQGSSFYDHANLTMENARNLDTLVLSGTTFEKGSTLNLNGTDFVRLYVHWDRIENVLVYNGETYLRLVKSFNDIEYFEDADVCYYQYRRERQSLRSWGEWAKYTDILGWVTCGYGVRAGNTLALGLFVISVCAVYYWRRDAIRRLKGDGDKKASFWDAFYFSMMTFTTVGYGDWYPLDEHRKVVMFQGIVGWLLLSLFLVTLANVIIR